VVDENLPWWKLSLIIGAVCLMVFCILLLCYCIRAQQEPDERQAKVTEFLRNQEEQRKSGFPVGPNPILFPASQAQVPASPSQAVSGEVPFYPPAEPVSSTTTLLPPDSVSHPNSNAETPVGFYIPPEIQQVYASEESAAAAASNTHHQPLERY